MASTTYQGLGTFTKTLQQAGQHSIQVTAELPGLQEGSKNASVIVMTINQNNTTIYTSQPGDRGLLTYANITPGDTISLVTSSSSVINELNTGRFTVSISTGTL